MINTFVHLMIQKIKKFLDCQTLPEKYFGLPEFSTRRHQLLQMGGRSPPLPPCLLRLWLWVQFLNTFYTTSSALLKVHKYYRQNLQFCKIVYDFVQKPSKKS